MKFLSEQEVEVLKLSVVRENFLKKFYPIFSEPSHLWMKKVVKHQHKNSKFQGMCAINWSKLKLLKRRR